MDLTAISFFLNYHKRISVSTDKTESKASFFVIWSHPNGKYYIRERGPNIKSKPKIITYDKVMKILEKGRNIKQLKHRRDW